MMRNQYKGEPMKVGSFSYLLEITYIQSSNKFKLISGDKKDF